MTPTIHYLPELRGDALTAEKPTPVRVRKGHVLSSPDGTSRFPTWEGRLPESVATELSRRDAVQLKRPPQKRGNRKRS